MITKKLSIVVSLGLILTVVGLLTSAQVAREIPLRVVSEFQAPGPSPRDLAWDGERLWLIDDAIATLYQIDPLKGEVTFELPLYRIEGMPEVSPSGLAWFDQQLMIADSESSTLYVVNPSERTVVAVLPLLEFGRAEGVRSIALVESPISGLTSDGKRLWATFWAGYSSSIYRIEPYEGLFTQHFWAAGRVPMGLAWLNRSLWVVDGASPGRINELTAKGEPTGAFIPSPGASPSGLASDGTALWVADRETQAIYRIQLLN